MEPDFCHVTWFGGHIGFWKAEELSTRIAMLSPFVSITMLQAEDGIKTAWTQAETAFQFLVFFTADQTILSVFVLDQTVSTWWRLENKFFLESEIHKKPNYCFQIIKEI